MNYYDLILAAIPLSLIGLTAVLSVLGISFTTAVPLAGGVSAGMVGHAMFVNGPVDPLQD